MYRFVGKYKQFWQLDIQPTIKLNYRCEENPPGSGNFKCDVTKDSDKNLDKVNKLRLKDAKSQLKEIKARHQQIRDQMDTVKSNSPEWKELQKKLDIGKEYEIEKHIRVLSYKHPDVPETFKPFLMSSDSVISTLPEQESEQLRLYVNGFGNPFYQGFLNLNNGKIPDSLEDYTKKIIGKRYSFDNGKFDPNDHFQKEEYELTLKSFQTSIDKIKLMDNILSKSVLQNDMIVQTGVSSALLDLNDGLSVGTEFEIPTYVSTSRSETIANGFALMKYQDDKKNLPKNRFGHVTKPNIPTVLEFHLKSGSKALALENFVLKSAGADAEWIIGDKGVKGTGSQQEVLVARGTKCKVTGIHEVEFRGKKIRKLIVDAYN